MALPKMVTPQEVASALNLSRSTLRRLRREGIWVEGAHYYKFGHNLVRYDLELCTHWLRTQDCPQLHQQEVARVLRARECNPDAAVALA